jgi:hypothetical protein
VALRAFCPEAASEPGVDVIVDDRDRHVLQLLRDAGHRLAHHPPSLAIARLESQPPNEHIRVHFPSTPPLATAFEVTEVRSWPDRRRRSSTCSR